MWGFYSLEEPTNQVLTKTQQGLTRGARQKNCSKDKKQMAPHSCSVKNKTKTNRWGWMGFFDQVTNSVFFSSSLIYSVLVYPPSVRVRLEKAYLVRRVCVFFNVHPCFTLPRTGLPSWGQLGTNHKGLEVDNVFCAVQC